MLLMIRAQAAVIRAAELGAALQVERPVAGLDVILAQPPIGGVGGDERGLDAVPLAALSYQTSLSRMAILAGTKARQVSHSEVVWPQNT